MIICKKLRDEVLLAFGAKVTNEEPLLLNVPGVEVTLSKDSTEITVAGRDPSGEQISWTLNNFKMERIYAGEESLSMSVIVRPIQTKLTRMEFQINREYSGLAMRLRDELVCMLELEKTASEEKLRLTEAAKGTFGLVADEEISTLLSQIKEAVGNVGGYVLLNSRTLKPSGVHDGFPSITIVREGEGGQLRANFRLPSYDTELSLGGTSLTLDGVLSIIKFSLNEWLQKLVSHMKRDYGVIINSMGLPKGTEQNNSDAPGSAVEGS